MEDENHISTSVSRDFILHLYLIYGILNLLVLLFDYFLWRIKLLFKMKFKKKMENSIRQKDNNLFQLFPIFFF